ncbi:MAG: tRNA (adenine-N1)-methyltransferase [SAR202 cluster bacterium]|nr:tRNA (adenine-N1)-methyltransferase [SAR202 cluster bacterium]
MVNIHTSRDLTHTFQEGDYALVIDRRQRRYMFKLIPRQKYSTHLGIVPHDELIGKEEGYRFATSAGHVLLAVKPTLADFTKRMPRIATPVYPKDMGTILVLGDIFPGARVLEAGTGSGAVTAVLARAVGDTGKVITYDVRQDMQDKAKKNLASIMPNATQVTFKIGDVYEGIEESSLDRIVLDLPDPLKVVPHAAKALVPGGIILSFVPTVLQVHDFTHALQDSDAFGMVETVETLMRPWAVAGRAIRPSLRMVGHTGFITTARRVAPRLRLPEEAAETSPEEQPESE